MSSMTRLLGNHARKRYGTCQNRHKPMRDGESQGAALNAVKSSRLEHVAARVAAVERPEGRQTKP